MNDRIDDFISGLQERIFEETRAAYGEIGFQRWRKPLYKGVMDDADGYGRLTGTCGDTMQIFLKFEKERVKAATYLTDGCGSSAVCGSLAAELALDRTPDEFRLPRRVHLLSSHLRQFFAGARSGCDRIYFFDL